MRLQAELMRLLKRSTMSRKNLHIAMVQATITLFLATIGSPLPILLGQFIPQYSLLPNAEAQEGSASKITAKSKSKWYLVGGAINSYPLFHDAKRRSSREIDDRARMFIPDWKNVENFWHERRDGLIWSGFIGVGYSLTDKFDLFIEVGGSLGKVENDGRFAKFLAPIPFRPKAPGIDIGPVKSDVDFERSLFFAGLGAFYFPMGNVNHIRSYHGFFDRLKGAKPFLSFATDINYLGFDLEVNIRSPLLGTLQETTVSENRTIVSFRPAVGIDLPITRRLIFSPLVGYSFFASQSTNFNGPSISLALKLTF